MQLKDEQEKELIKMKKAEIAEKLNQKIGQKMEAQDKRSRFKTNKKGEKE